MKNLIICCDGTWNTPDQEHRELLAPTNVCRLYNAVETDGDVVQERYYHPGVGSEGSFLERQRGGAFGDGLIKNIISAYVWLSTRYEDGDQVYLFGFSRGAFTVRSLCGMISSCGLLDLEGLTKKETFARAVRAFSLGYREPEEGWCPSAWRFRADGKMPIRFLGVWDTVGALGIPDDFGILNMFDKSEKWEFHNTTLGDSVQFARQAVALDEMRASFSATLWTDKKTSRPMVNTERVQQRWFPGVHSDVGGGYYECGLSDTALKWMMEEADRAGLKFREKMVQQLDPDPRGPMHNSLRGFYERLRTRPRWIPSFTSGTEYLHVSAIDRHGNPPISDAPYHHTRDLGIDEECELDIYAREHWNVTGLHLKAGCTYRFSAAGEWLDKEIACGPDGTKDGKFSAGEIAHVVGSLMGGAEEIFKRLTKNEQADFFGTKREERMPWFVLVGVVANDGEPKMGTRAVKYDGSPRPHETFEIGTGPIERTIVHPGYFYAFANDAWSFYGNNRGSVRLTVRRIA